MIITPKRTIYFSHPVNVYHKILEQNLLRVIAEKFPGWTIVNPSEKKHEEGYKKYTRDCGNGMQYFFTEVLPDCDKNISLPFRDGMFGAGVAGEAKTIALAHQCDWTWFILSNGEIGIMAIRDMKILSIEATRRRIRDEQGNTLAY